MYKIQFDHIEFVENIFYKVHWRISLLKNDETLCPEQVQLDEFEFWQGANEEEINVGWNKLWKLLEKVKEIKFSHVNHEKFA